MRRSLGILLAAWALFPSGASACGLSGPWYVTSDDGYTGIFIIEKVIDEARCEARLNASSPLGESAAEVCRVLRSDKVVVYCDIISASHFFWTPDNFTLEDQGEGSGRAMDFGHIGKRRFSEAVASASNCRHRRCGTIARLSEPAQRPLTAGKLPAAIRLKRQNTARP